MVDPNSKNDRKLQELMKVSVQFFNSLILAIEQGETAVLLVDPISIPCH